MADARRCSAQAGRSVPLRTDRAAGPAFGAGPARHRLPAHELAAVHAVLARFAPRGAQFHALRSRQAGARRLVSLHVLVPGAWSVQQGHALLEAVEDDIRQALPSVTVFTHLEPVEDPTSWQATQLDRAGGAGDTTPGPMATDTTPSS